MNDKQKQLYSYLKDNDLTDLDLNTFFSKYSDPSKSKEIHAYLKQNGMTDLDANAFHVAYFSPVKKKSTTGSQSVQKKKPTSSVTMPSWMQSSLEQSSKKEQPKKPVGPQVVKSSQQESSAAGLTKEEVQNIANMGVNPMGSAMGNVQPKKQEERDFDIYYGYPGQEKNEYRISNGRWQRKYGEKWVEVSNQGSIDALTKFFGKEKEILKEEVFTGFPGKEKNKYRVSELQNGQKVWEVQREGQKDYTVIGDQGSIDALNRQFNKKVEYTENAQLKREAQINRRESASEDFKTVTGELVGKESDEVAAYLRKMYGDRGFSFTPTGVLTDNIRVTSDATGKSEVFVLDNFRDETDSAEALKLRKFLSENQQLGDYIDLEREEKKKAEEEIIGTQLTQEDVNRQMGMLNIAGNQAEFKLAQKQNVEENIIKDLNKQSTDVIEARKTLIRADYDTKQRIDDLTRTAKTDAEKQEVAAIAMANKYEFVKNSKLDNEYLNDLNKSSKSLDQSFKTLNSDVEEFNRYIKENNITQEQLENDPELIAQKQELQVRYDQLIANAEDLDFENKKLPFIQNQNARNAALYFAYNETRGSVIGGVWNGLVRGALSSLQTFRIVDKEGLDNLVKTFGSYTTKEFASSENRNDFSRALLSTSESLGAAAAAVLTGGLATEGTIASKALGFIPYFSVSYNEIKNEIDQIPGMDKAPWYKKEALAIAYGLGVGYLDKLSTDFQVKGKISNKIGRDLVLRSIAGLPKGATAEAIEMAIASNFKKDLASGAIKIVAGSVVEGVTEGVQSAYGTGLKEVYDWMNGVDEFDSREWVSQAFEEAYYGALGGAIMSTPSTLINGAKNGFARLDPKDMELARKVIEDSNMRSMVITDIKAKLMSGEITKEEANAQMEAINESMALFTKIPDNLSAEDTSKSMDLIKERSKIEKEISGKDESLVAPQKARIAEINNELTKISEDATKKSTEQQQEVTAEGGGVQPQGIVEGQPEVGQGEGTVGQATTNEADTGNRPIEGRGKEEVTYTPVSGRNTILNKDINVSDNSGRKGLVPLSELEDFIGEDRSGAAETPQSRATIDKLKEDISKNGFKEPIVLVYDKFSNGGEASIIEGNHRIIAAKELGLKEIPVTFEKGTIRDNEKRVSEGMFPLNRKKVGSINDTYGVKGSDLGLTVRQPLDSDYATIETSIPTEAPAENTATKEMPKAVETTDTKSYSDALAEAKRQMKEDGSGLDMQVSDVSKEEADAILAEGGKIFMTEDGMAGAYVKKDGYMGGLFKNPKAKISEVGKVLQQARVAVGGKFMDAYATKLEDIYIKNGFRPVARMKFNPEYAPKGWDAPGSPLANQPDVVFFAYDPEGKYSKGDGQYVEDYDAAYEMAKNFDAKAANEADKLAAIIDKKAAVSKDTISKEEVSKRVSLAQKALSVVLPDVKFVVHDTDESYRKAVGEMNKKEQSSSGAYDMVSKTIHVNSTKANKRTVSHEVFHAIIISKTSSDKQLQKLTSNMVNAVIKSLKQTGTNQEVINYLNDFASNYESNLQNEEKLVELHGILGENMIDLPVPTQNIIKRFLDRLAKMFGLKEMTDREAVEFMNTMSSKVETGKEITATEFKKVKPSKIDRFGNLSKPSKSSIENLSNRKQNIVDETKSNVVEGKIVSTRLPKQDDIHSTDKYIVSMSSLEESAKDNKGAKDQYIKIATEISSYGISKIKDVETFEDAQKVVKEFKDAVKSNLKWLYNSFGNDVRDISKLWYDGANKICNKISSEYNYSLEQVSGVMAVLSPQMDWFRNLSLGERVIDIYTNQQDSLFDSKMIDYVKNATSGTGKNKVPLFKDAEEIVSRVDGKKLSELNNKDKAYFIRVFDEVYNSREYNNISPNGEVNGLVRKGDGTPGACGWGGFSTIEKSISILQDGSINNISSNLGNMHKVRNFFNNISNPNDNNAVTIDTHAVAAGLLLPLSGSSKQVLYNFGGAGNVGTGMTGTYPVYADAYRELANELGLLPREVQSITWEAVRGLFKATFKSNKNNETKINNVWDKYSSGEISLDQAHSEISNIAGGISKPVWFEYMADDNIKSLDQNSAAVDQAKLDDESGVVLNEPIPKAQIEEEVKTIEEDIDTEKPSFRKQKVSKQTEMIVKKGKEAGLSDAGIREYMKRNGYTDRQATDAIQSYNDKKEGIFIDPNWSKLRKAAVLFNRKFFSSRGLLTNTVFASNEKRLATIAKELNKAQKLITDFDRALDNIKKEAIAQYRKDITAYINGDVTVDLPADIKSLIDKKTGVKDRIKIAFEIKKLAEKKVEQSRADFDSYIRDKQATLPIELKKIADSMRAHIDSISKELIYNGLIEEDLAAKVIDNMGSYLNRSYKIYDRKNWKKEVEKEVKDKAINFLKIQLRPIAEEQAKKDNRDVDDVLDDLARIRIERYLSQQEEDMALFSSGGKLGSKNLSVLKAREEIPVEIRMLMGEYTDPGQNYARTILKMSGLAANHQFLNEVKKAGTGVFLFEKNDASTPKGYTHKIAAEGSATMNPLNGMFTSKELKEEFEKQSSQLSKFWSFYMNILSRVKWGKTIMSPATHLKNLIGNIGFVLINGHWRIGEMSTAYKAVRDDLLSLDKKQSREYVNRLIELGIIKQSAGMGEIRAMFADASWEESMLSNINKKSGSRWSSIKSGWNKFTKLAEDVYQAEDDFYKIFAYENELSRYSKAMFGKSKNELTESERSEVDAVVAEIVKNTYPTYSRIPEAVNMIRRAPLIGNFVSFQAESYRTAYMTAKLAMEEIKSDNPKIRQIGAQRIAGALTYKSIKTAILAYYSYASGLGAVGVLGYFTDDEEEKQKEDDIRKFLPDWSVNSDLVVKKASDGKIVYIDMSASDPHGGINKVLNSIMLGETSFDSFVAGLGSIVEPFIGEEMTTAAFLSIKNNEDTYGKPIYNPEDTFYEQSNDIIGFMFNVVQPGVVSSGRRVAKAEKVGEEVVGAITGARTYNVDIADNFGYQMIKYQDRLLNANRIYTSEVYNKDATEKSIADAKKRAEKAVTDIHAEIYDLYYSALRLGADEDKLYDNLKSFGGMTKRTINYMFDQEDFYIKDKYPEEEE